ncbi:uncharacterized protein LOC117329753 [Pecten maximus]|uniref:uncharacterized protein LOC117329753 n=1 Tax=Pecten maximus TaxID=6579 RepID=UPI0014586017|nr:uncharacterized protein LOC117329753 [Pecten maximus]
MCRVFAENFNEDLPCISKNMKYCVVCLFFTLLFDLGLGIRGFSNYLRCTNEVALPARDRDAECERKAEEGSCEFFACYEERFPCRRCGYAANPERNFCRRFYHPNNYRNFDLQGQQWIASAHLCLNRIMLSLYVQNRVSCAVSMSTMMSAVAQCYLGNPELSFCEVFQRNQQAFLQLYDSRDLPAMLRAAEELRELREFCGIPDHVFPFSPIH